VVALAALTGGSVAAAGASPGATPSKYYAIYKISGSFTGKFNGQAVANYSQTEKGSWTYQEKFGPFSVKTSTAHVKTHDSTFSGGWSYEEQGSPSTTCHTSGKWVALNLPPTMKSTAAHGGLKLVLTGGTDPLGNYFTDPSCSGVAFFGSCGTYIGRALAKAGSNCPESFKPEYFVTDLSVSQSALKNHKYVYHVSNTRKGSEQVAKDCNQGMYYTCSYSWSGTVTFKPAG
jgi:hypothetical protein